MCVFAYKVTLGINLYHNLLFEPHLQVTPALLVTTIDPKGKVFVFKCA